MRDLIEPPSELIFPKQYLEEEDIKKGINYFPKLEDFGYEFSEIDEI